MGKEQINAARNYYYNTGEYFIFETFPYTSSVTTFSADNSITDSAAAATAIATGYKVNNSVISIATPGDNSEYQTILEYYKSKGYWTGLITTAYLTHATPAAFGAHTSSRNNTTDIANDYLTDSKPNILMGGGDNGLSASDLQNNGYYTITNRTDFMVMSTSNDYTAAIFGTGHLPYEYDGDYSDSSHLSEMVSKSLEIMENNNNYFFLMIEGGRIDHAGHDNNIERNIYETIEFSKAVEEVYDWASGREDVLIIVTADHETGGLEITNYNGKNNFPDVTWSTTGHTDKNVNLYMWGKINSLYTGNSINDNTDIFNFMKYQIN